MDKVRAFLKVLYQQRFWVLSVVGIIVAAVCWMMASGSLDAEFVTNKQKIESEFTNMRNITSKSFHGNDAVNQAEREQTKLVHDQVLALWKKMYEKQREKVLQWPASLGEEFLNYVDKLKFRDNIADPNIRQIYREFARERFPELVEIVQARKMPLDAAAGGIGGTEFGGIGGRGGDMGGALPVEQYDAAGNLIPAEKYLVEWLDQGLVRQELTFSERPSSLQIWVTQEDLWVYETLLNVIARANEANNATRPDNAAIRWIMALEVGQKAAEASKVRGQVILPPGLTGAEGMGEAGMGMGREGGMGVEGVDMDAMLLAGRYIGPDGLPLADGTTVSGGEFRMLPVRLQLMMEQKAIPSVLIECANAALPIEVKRIRINADQSGAGFDATMAVAAMPGAEGGGGRGMTDGGGRGSMDYGRGGGGRGGEGMMPTMTPGTSTAGLATVEIQGIVYIYNPPDPAVLSVPGGDDATIAAADAGTAPL